MLCNLERYRDLSKRKTAKNQSKRLESFLGDFFSVAGFAFRGSHGEVGRICTSNVQKQNAFPDNFCSQGITCTNVSASLLGGTASREHPLNLLKAELVGAGEGLQNRGREVRGASARHYPFRGREQSGRESSLEAPRRQILPALNA